MTVIDTESVAHKAKPEAIKVKHFIRGKLVTGDEVRHTSRDLGVDFTTPAIDLDALVTPRSEMPPLYDVKLSEIVDFLVETGERLDLDRNPYLQESLEFVVATNPLPRRIIENLFRRARHFITRDALMAGLNANFPDLRYFDEWVERTDAHGQTAAMRAFPPRMIHMLAGNSPAGCVSSIAQGAMLKAINVFKMPSSDPFSCVAVLRTMADVDPNHPVVKSMSAIYWRGGDERIERTLYRPQYFNRIIAWGGGSAIDNVIRYLCPGLQLVSFDPKTSISMIGPEAFQSDETIAHVAEAAAADVTTFNQEACLASRFIFVEGDRADIEKFCAKLQERLGVDRDLASAVALPPPMDLQEEVAALQVMDEAQVWGKPDGRGMVLLTDEPVPFHPTNKTANVVHLKALEDAIRYVNVATQTVGIYPEQTKVKLRDRLANAGAQRVVRLGSASTHVMGSPHDAMFPLQRMVHWMSQENA
ncbi:MAG: acyl-CoA reductase [Rhizomicrobium sp.]